MHSNKLTRNRFIFPPLFLFLFLVPLSRTSAMSVPSPYSPSNGVTFTAFEVFMWWQPITGATGYEYMYDTTATFNSPVMVHDTCSTNYFYTHSLWMNRKYRWKLRAFKSGDTSAWSTVSSFNVNLATPCTTYPQSGNTGAITLFSCNGGALYVKVGFQFEADTTPAFNSPLHVFRNDTIAYFQDTILFDFGRTIYWRARAFNMRGDTMGWSAVSNFTFSSVPNLNGSTGILMTDPMHIATWTSAGLATIEFQLDTLNTFNSNALKIDYLPKNSSRDTLNNLKFGKTYYYRNRFWYGGRPSVWSVVRTIKVYSNGNIYNPYMGETFGGLTNIGFSWRTLDATRVQIQLFNDSLYQQVLKDTVTSSYGYTYKGMLVLNKRYAFRIRYCTLNDTTPWLSSNFRTYTGQPNLGSPYDNATAQPVRLRLSFRKTDWANRYVMEIDTGIVFGQNPSRFYITTDTFKYDGYYSYIDTLLGYGKRYVWRVRAFAPDGSFGEPATRKFTTIGQPVNYYPPNMMIGTGTETNFLVTGITGSDSLEWERDTTVLFNSDIKDAGKVLHIPDDFTPQYVAVDLPGSLHFHWTYYWRVRCINRIDTSKWSNPFQFQTTQEVWVVSPADRAVNVPYNPTLEWGIQGSSNTLIYQFRINTDSNMLAQSGIITLPAESSPSRQVTLVYGRTYYWQARALNPADTSHWSPMFRFTTVNPPGLLAPVLGLPSNGANNINPKSVSFSWNYVSGALQYQLQVTKESSFTNFLVDTIITPTNFIWKNAEVKTRYYWRVRARYNEFTGNWSGGRYFDTAPPTGIELTGGNDEFEYYPMPADDQLSLRLPVNSSYRLIDIKGSVVMSGSFDSGVQNLNTSALANGCYYLILENSMGTLTRKLVIAHP